MVLFFNRLGAPSFLSAAPAGLLSYVSVPRLWSERARSLSLSVWSAPAKTQQLSRLATSPDEAPRLSLLCAAARRQQASRDPRCHGLDLGSFFIMPVQVKQMGSVAQGPLRRGVGGGFQRMIFAALALARAPAAIAGAMWRVCVGNSMPPLSGPPLCHPAPARPAIRHAHGRPPEGDARGAPRPRRRRGGPQKGASVQTRSEGLAARVRAHFFFRPVFGPCSDRWIATREGRSGAVVIVL